MGRWRDSLTAQPLLNQRLHSEVQASIDRHRTTETALEMQTTARGANVEESPGLQLCAAKRQTDLCVSSLDS
jgi:hypothetical protein